MFDYFDTPVSSCYFPLLDAGERIASALVKAVEGAGVATLQTVERTEFIQRPAPDPRRDALADLP